MIKPKKLEFGDTIGIVAPSSPCYDEEKIEVGKEKLEGMGFRVKLGKSCFSRYGYLSGRDELRAEDINDMFLDNEVDGIICLRGGYGSPRILDKIDFQNIQNNPKVFVGYSDITAIHIAINQFSNVTTFHGPMIIDMDGEFNVLSKISLLNNTTKIFNTYRVLNPKGEEITCINGGRAQGILVGGNLSLICATLGTPYEIDTRGKILFLEDIDEEPYKIDRMLTQLYLAGKLNEAAGIILGDWNNCVAEKPTKSLSLLEVFRDIITPIEKPTIYNLKAGHCNPMITLPMGINVLMDANKGELIIKESGVI